MFDDRVHQRGALTLHALRTVLGDDTLFAVLREWTATYRHATVPPRSSPLSPGAAPRSLSTRRSPPGSTPRALPELPGPR
ncbi:hypothetical protein GCM10017744_080710 [Streptomyces antimycoticus]|uniref:Uncharacterized protein n=1 Tax=Streptomyces antimycoticus TaxID=68175 RepID=A0A4D4K278_9ACTN|nr:hypothetical protein [Streptomyces antimycoticus]GDY41180.1 hypothetical protein SANT12839_020620 [Streptomyces antimycoticus]